MRSKLAFMAVSFLLFCVSAYGGIQVSVPEINTESGSAITVEIHDLEGYSTQSIVAL